MKKKIIHILLCVCLLIGAVAVSGFFIKSKPIPKKDASRQSSMYVKAEKARVTETKTAMSYRGRIAPFDKVVLSSEVNGKIMSGDVRFKEGESFKKGDVLIRIYSEDVEAVLKSGKSSFMQTLAIILPDIKIDYPLEFEKWNRFFALIDPEKELPKLPKIQSDKEKVFLASNNVLSTYYNLQQQEINLKRYVIRAPFNGVFKTVNKETGAIASPGSELATLIRTDKLEVIVPVFPIDLQWIKRGNKVNISGNNKSKQLATVSRIARFVDEETQSVNVYLNYSSSEKNLFLEGEYVDVQFGNIKIMGFKIPREAVIDKTFVYELTDGTLQKREIQVVRQLNDNFIIQGVDSTKMIVTESLATVNYNMEYLAR